MNTLTRELALSGRIKNAQGYTGTVVFDRVCVILARYLLEAGNPPNLPFPKGGE